MYYAAWYKNRYIKMTHQAPANWWSIISRMVSVVWFSRASALAFLRTDGRTDTTYESSDHLFGRGLVGQYNN